MARQKSEFVSAFGTAFEAFKSLSDEVLSLGGSDDNIRRIISDRKVRRQLAELLVGNGIMAENLFPITIDYGKTFDQRIADGKYDWKNGDITAKRFPPPLVTGKVDAITELIHFDRSISSDDALAELDRMGYRAATIEELLAFGAKYPEKQREFPIVALGSVTRRVDGRHVAYLWYDSFERGLGLGWFGDDWGERYRFLAVRK